jgi:hypothetical protein
MERWMHRLMGRDAYADGDQSGQTMAAAMPLPARETVGIHDIENIDFQRIWTRVLPAQRSKTFKRFQGIAAEELSALRQREERL